MNPGTLSGFGRPPQKLLATPSQPSTVMTSGTGVFKPKAGTLWLRVRKWGAGGASGSAISGTGTYGVVMPGGRGQYTEEWIKNTLLTYSWQVGAGGVAPSGVGGNTTFSNTTPALGGKGSSSGLGAGAFAPGLPAADVGPGAGGAPGFAYNGNSITGTNGNDGLIIVEEY